MPTVTIAYDEDFDDLVCRDITFEEGDYFDLSKHSPEQILHLSKFYDSEPQEYSYLVFSDNMLCVCRKSWHHIWCTGKEYHFNDVFVTQEQYEAELLMAEGE